MRSAFIVLGCGVLSLCSIGVVAAQELPDTRIAKLEAQVENLRWQLDQVRKIADDNQFYLRLSDVAEVDKVTRSGTCTSCGSR